MKRAQKIRILLVWGLPLLLLALTGALLGFYYESNDDVAITQVIRGETAAAPVANLHLYFHGLSYLLAALYRAAPVVPWFGILLYTLFYLSLVLLYQVLFNVLEGRLSTAGIAVVFSVLYWVAWQETALLMNFTRLPVLLTGIGLLYAASRAGRGRVLAVGLLFVVLGWSIRPSAAVVGLVAALPGAWWLARWRAVGPVVWAGGLLVACTTLLSWQYSPVEATYRRLDVWKASYSDFLLYQPRPVTAADSLGILSVNNWALGDSTIVNEGLFERAVYFDQSVFLHFTILHKAFASFYALRDNYALLVLFPMVVGVWLLRRGGWRRHWEFWLAQVAFAALLLVLTAFMKLPLRLASSLLCLWTVNTVVYVARLARWPVVIAPAWRYVAYAALLVFSGKLWYESRGYRRAQLAHEAYLSRVYALAKNRVLVQGGVEWAYEYLSPFTTYELSDRPVVTLMSWLTLEPSLTDLRAQLTGTRDFEESLNRLASRPDVVWVMRDSCAAYLRAYSRRHRPQSATVLVPVRQQILDTNPEYAQLYTVELRPRRNSLSPRALPIALTPKK